MGRHARYPYLVHRSTVIPSEEYAEDRAAELHRWLRERHTEYGYSPQGFHFRYASEAVLFRLRWA
ncbi:hypothetical protein Mnod_7693 (plasmid) [Methylobacterium nodulans ORS 2060]|uniref:Uncharacterized protein n=1 Tax=Methylobacterium nodulans (strain LMG 21967 / CNCM I-2342 / ORS 2060) TaxID=460265 RepID=B8IXZ7_METNO|nr:hypothetical protein Mnod_7693 [Methylobacterium nodulans ORS 2060]